MSKFTDTYIKKYAGSEKSRSKEISDDPIMAMVNGVGEKEVIETLRHDGWNQDEIDDLIQLGVEAKSRIKGY